MGKCEVYAGTQQMVLLSLPIYFHQDKLTSSETNSLLMSQQVVQINFVEQCLTWQSGNERKGH